MGIVGRFSRRKARERIRWRHHPHSKHRLATLPSKTRTSPSSVKKIQSITNEDKLSLKDDNHKGLGIVIQVDSATSTIIQQEVVDLLQSSSDHSCTALSMANALAQSQACLESHSKIREKHHANIVNKFLRNLGETNVKTMSPRPQSRGKISFKLPNFFSRKTENESMRSRYEWVGALDRLEKFPSSRNKVISSWKEAKVILEQVVIFPFAISPSGENNPNQCFDSSPKQPLPSIAMKHAKNLESEMQDVQENVNALSFSSVKWKQIVSYPDQEGMFDRAKKGDQTVDNEDLETLIKKESIDKADLYFNARIQTAEALDEALRGKNDAVKKLEERMKANEARKRALSLMRILNDDEQEIVKEAIHGFGHDQKIIAQVGADSVQRASMRTLKPGMWLNDEIIHYFYLMLAKRDEELCKNDPSRKRSHFFKSFFITKLLNEGNASCDGKYEYRNVKRWSKKVPGKDIFDLDKILFPINMGNMHWICAAIFMKKKRIEIFDSMGGKGNTYLDALFNYIQDEHIAKKNTPLPDADAWELVPTRGDTPRQRNGYDCGVFTCMFADFLSKDTALVFNQDHINQCRERIALSIMKGKAIM